MTSAILAIDAATEACSVALQYQGQVFNRFEICPQQHSQWLLPMIDEVLKQAGISLADLDLLAFGSGPGSFTGVRIGVGVAQGLAFGADLPVIGLSTLQTMAQAAIRLHSATGIIATIDARMGEIYSAQYHNVDGLACPLDQQTVCKPELAVHTLVDSAHAVGTGWQTYLQVLAAKTPLTIQTEILYPDALDMLTLAAYALAANLPCYGLEIVSAEQAQPIYVRDTVTWQKLPGR